MSNENQNTILKFDTLLGEDTLKKHLEHILNLANRITNSLTIEDGKNVTLAQLKSIKTYLTEIHELSRIKLTLEGTGKKLGGEYGSYGNIQEIMAELKALRTQLGVQQQLSTKQASELKAKAFQGADLTGYDASNPQHRKAVKEGLEQRSTIVKLNKDQIDTLKKINETELAILAAKREEARNVRKQQRQTDVLEKRTTDEKRNILAQHMREAKEGTLTKTSLRSNYKEDERGLKAIALSASKAQYDTTLSEKQKTKARAVAIEAQKLLDTLEQKKVTSKLSSPKGLSFFEKLTTTDLARAKGETEIQNLRAHIKLLQRQGKEEERLKLHETLVGAKKIMATKFAPVSPYQEAFTKEKKAAISLGRLSPDAIKTLTQDEVTKHLKASEIRSHKTLAPFGSKEHALELEYQKALKQRTQAINDEAQAAKKVADARLKEELNRQKEVEKTLNRAGKISLAPLESAPQYTVEAKKQLKSDLFKKARTGELGEKDLQEFIQAGLGDKSRLLKELKSLQTQTRKAELDPNLITTLDNAPKKLNLAISGVIAQLNLEQEAVKGATQAAKKVAEARLKEELNRQKDADKAAKYQQRLANDPSFAASERLKGEKGALVAGSVDARSKSQQLGDTRLQAKVAAEQEKILAIAQQRYHTEDKIRALQPEQVKHARDTLNYHAETVQHIKAEREQVEKLRLLFNEIHGTSNKRAAQAGLIADLEKTHYKTKESLRNLGREELQQAIEVLKYRTKTVAATEQQRAEAQHLLNLANQQYKLNPENQAEHRQSNVTRVLGDSGASLLLIQSGLMLNYKLLGGIQSLFSGAIDSAIKLDSAFRQLQAISAATNYEMAALKVNLINVAQASKFSAAEVGETAVLLAQAGLSTQEIGASMKGVITLAQATGTDLAKSVDVVTSVLSVFNKSASETNNIVNQLTEALNRSKLDIQKVALGIQYAGNISADAGISFEELTSALGAMANAGIRSGSTLGTGLRQMIIDLEKPSEKLKARLRFLGVSLDEVDLRANGLEGTLKNLREAGFTTADAFQTFEVRSAAAFAALTGNLDDFHGLQEALADTNAAFDANYVQMEALAVQIDHLKSNLGIVAAEGLKPVTALMRDLAKATSHAMENAEEGSGVLRVFSTALASMVTGVTIGWLTSLIIRLYEVIAAARLAAATATGFGAALLASGPVIAGVVAAIGLFTAAAYSYSSEMDRLNDKLDKAKGKFNEQKEILATTKDNLQNVGTAISNLTSKYGELSEDHSALTTQALQLEKQFGSMGFTIDNLANLSVPELMRKLRELRAELSQKYDMELGETMKKALDEIKARREAANEKLKQKEFTPAGLRAAAEGYKGYIGNVYKDTGNDRDVREAAAQAYQNRRDIGNSPEAEAVSKMVAALFNKTATAIENAKGTEIKSSQLNLDYEKALIVSSAAYRSQTVSSEAVTEALDKLTDTVAAYNVKATSSKQAELTVKKYKRDQQLNRFTSAMNDPVAAFAQGEQDLASYQEFKSQEQIKKNTVKGDKGAALDAYTISVGKRATTEKSRLQPYIGAIQTKVESLRKQLKQLKETDANYGAVNLELTAKQTELEEFRKLEANYRDEIASYEELTTKNSANALKKKLDSLKKQYELLKKRYADDYTSKGSKNLEGELSRKLGEINEIEKQIAALDKSPKEAIVAATMNAETARQSLSDLVKDQQGRLKEYKASKAAALKDFLTDKDYEAYKKGYEDWFKAQELSDKLWESSQRSQAEQLKYRTQGILSSSAMFSEINSDLKKQAQVQANATGISQEYSKYGSGAGGYFARQAAKKAEAKNNLKRQQEKLARSLTSEKAYSDKALEIAPNFEITQQALREASDTLIAKMQESKDLTKPKDIMEAELKTAQQNFDLLKRLHDTQNSLLEQAVKGKEEAHARAQEAIDALEATVFNPIDELTKSLRAGQEAMSSGLSTIMGDWASGMIQNTEDVTDAFEAMGKSILQSMLKVITDRTATMFTDMLLGKADGSTGLGVLGNLFGGLFGGLIGGGKPSVGVGTGEVSLGLSQGGFLNGNYQGARHYAGGGYVSGTDIGHDIIPAYLRPKEYVLKPTTTSALGKPFLDRLNSVTTGSLKQLEGKAQAQAPQISVVQSPPTNIYVVSPDQQRQMGVNDVVVSIEDNIMRNGSIKQLIKQVVSGQV